MACCRCCCGNVDCEEGQQGKCCCGGVEGTCCTEEEYCCDGVCQEEPCDPPCSGSCDEENPCPEGCECCDGVCLEECKGACCTYFCGEFCLECEWTYDGVDTLTPNFDVSNPPQADACPTGECSQAQCPNQPLLPNVLEILQEIGAEAGFPVSERYCCTDSLTAVCFENVTQEECEEGSQWILNGVCGGGSGSTNTENAESCLAQVFP
jgi:hypothetical protein